MNEAPRPPMGPSLPGQRPAAPALTPRINPPAPAGPAKIAPMPTQPVRSHDEDLEPISLVDEPSGPDAGVSKIKSFGVAGAHATHSYKRQPNANGTGACRVRSFHGRLSDEGMAFLDDKINEWLDQHPEVEVKFVNTTIGQFEGKIREPALVVNVWY
jgi:hypothetical protein